MVYQLDFPSEMDIVADRLLTRRETEEIMDDLASAIHPTAKWRAYTASSVQNGHYKYIIKVGMAYLNNGTAYFAGGSQHHPLTAGWRKEIPVGELEQKLRKHNVKMVKGDFLPIT